LHLGAHGPELVHAAAGQCAESAEGDDGAPPGGGADYSDSSPLNIPVAGGTGVDGGEKVGDLTCLRPLGVTFVLRPRGPDGEQRGDDEDRGGGERGEEGAHPGRTGARATLGGSLRNEIGVEVRGPLPTTSDSVPFLRDAFRVVLRDMGGGESFSVTWEAESRSP
jgi:hypothetical protein